MWSNVPSQETGDVNPFKEDRPEGVEGVNYYFNPNKSLSISQQRKKLPIYAHRDDILFLLESFQTLIIQGETGCGKSTQVPQYLVEEGWTRHRDGKRMIGVTEPRKVAACTLAARVAEERGCPLGESVGYNVRFDEKWTADVTEIKFMTEGILIREMMSDPLLEKYSCIMIDEAHERTVNTDTLLGLLKRIAQRRQDLKIIISSATVEAEVLMDFFDLGASRSSKSTSTILCVEGRNHPIEVFYAKDSVANYVKASVDTVIAIHEHEPSGDVLVFLTGQDEVEEAVSLLVEYSRSAKERQDGKKMFVLPLHASLPSRDLFKVFETFPRSVRKVVVATNVAEASVTIPGITFVVDCGFVKMRFFNPKTRSDALAVVPISQASATQRAGRAGRTRPGKVFRLYPEDEFKKLATTTIPEVQRTNTAFLILQLKALGVKNILDFDFPSRPPEANVIAGLELLYALGAIDEDGDILSPLGLQMAEFPLEPMFSKMLLDSGKFECSDEVLTIVSMLQVENIFQQPSSGQRAIQARNAKHRFSVEEGDLITYLNIFNEFVAAGRVRSWADKNYLNYNALLRACEIRTRLVSLLRRFAIELITADGDLDAVRKCIVSGLFANAVYLTPEGERIYRTVRGDHELHIHPSSVLYTFPKPPKWLLFTEVLHTTQEFMRDLVAVEPQWLCEVAPQYFEFGTERQLLERRSIF